jgi:hypothetical protein
LNFFKKPKGAIQVHKKYIREIPDEKMKKDQDNHKSLENESNPGQTSTGKGYGSKKLLISLPLSCSLQNFDNLFLSRYTTLGKTVPTSTLLHYKGYQTALSNR